MSESIIPPYCKNCEHRRFGYMSCAIHSALYHMKRLFWDTCHTFGVDNEIENDCVYFYEKGKHGNESE